MLHCPLLKRLPSLPALFARHADVVGRPYASENVDRVRYDLIRHAGAVFRIKVLFVGTDPDRVDRQALGHDGRLQF